MPTKRFIPSFASEAEEAQWWFDNQDRFAADLKLAIEDGTYGVGTVAKRMQEASAVVLEPADAALAWRLAVSKGLSFDSYVKQLVHEQLGRETMVENERHPTRS